MFQFLLLKQIVISQLSNPIFEKKSIEQNREDGYWIEAIRSNNQPKIIQLIAYGLTQGQINLYHLTNTTTQSIIEKFDSPVAMDQADLTGDGFQDIIICFQYGRTMLDCDPDGGKIVWLQNPGLNSDQQFWKKHYIGKSTAMHRLKIGHFTQTQHWQIIGLPIVSQPNDLLSAVPVILFEQPENIFNATEWPYEIINQEYFHVIHDAELVKKDQLDTLLIASREGITWLYFDLSTNQWIIENIGSGESQQQETIFYGSGSLGVGKIGYDNFAYIATAEPFHGNTVAVYMKSIDNHLTQIQWKRYVLDVYGQANEQGEGPIHHIVCADFDNDGDDEFLVAFRGPSPNEGVYYYKLIDLSRGLFYKWKVSNDSAAKITLADFDNNGLLDFATISYAVPGYYISHNPSINIFYNKNNTINHDQFQIMKQNNQLLFKVPRPSQVRIQQTLPFITINEITLLLEILPPFHSRQIDNYTYIKVLWGDLIWIDSLTKINQSRTIFCRARSVCSLEIHSENNQIQAGSQGALIFIHKIYDRLHNLSPVENINKLIIKNSLPEYYSEELRQLTFQFVRYDQYQSDPQFKNVEFYNLKGFDIKFADNDESLCYIQLWAAGLGVNAGVHNHAKDTFCEIHVCLLNGNGKGGMHYLNSSTQEYDPLLTSDSEFQILPLPIFYEHGALWDIDAQNKPILRTDGTVVYPWHKWQAGNNASLNQSFDIWSVFEFSSRLFTSSDSSSGSSSGSSSLLNFDILWFFCFFIFFLFAN